MLTTALKIFSKVLNSDPEIGLAYSSYYVINEKSKRSGLTRNYDKDEVISTDDAFIRFAKGNQAQCAMTRRDIYSEIGLWDPDLKLVADWDAWCRIILAGYKVGYIEAPQNCYRLHSNNATNSFNRDSTYNSEIFKGSKKIFNSIAPHSSLQELRPLTAKWIFGSQFYNMTQAMEIGNWVTARRELGLFIRILRWAGIKEMWPDLRVLLSRTIKKHF